MGRLYLTDPFLIMIQEIKPAMIDNHPITVTDFGLFCTSKEAKSLQKKGNPIKEKRRRVRWKEILPKRNDDASDERKSYQKEATTFQMKQKPNTTLHFGQTWWENGILFFRILISRRCARTFPGFKSFTRFFSDGTWPRHISPWNTMENKSQSTIKQSKEPFDVRYLSSCVDGQE